MANALLTVRSQPVRLGLATLCRRWASSNVAAVKDYTQMDKKERAEVDALLAKYSKDVIEEVDVKKYESWTKAGYLDQGGVPNVKFFNRGPEYLKVWKWHMQRDDGKLVWEKGRYDSIVNGLVGCYVLVIICCLGFNTFWLICPPSKNPWIFKEGKVPPLIGSDH